MTSAIAFSTIDTTYPIPGRDNDSQGFRTNFSLLKTGLQTAAGEISDLQSGKASLTTTNVFENGTVSTNTGTGAVVIVGGVGIGGNLNVGGSGKIGGHSIITTASTFIGYDGDIVVGGYAGKPSLKIASQITGHIALFGGSLSINVDNPNNARYLMYAVSTATNQTGMYIKSQNTFGTGIYLESTSAAGANFSFISFVKNTGTPVSLGNLSHNGTTVTFSEKFKFEKNPILASNPPATSSAAGLQGEIAWDASYVYVCITDNVWKRAAITTW